MKKDTRDRQITRGFLATGFEFNDMHFKPLTGRTLLLLEMADSPFFVGGGGSMKQLLDVLYVSHEDCNIVTKAINEANFSEKVMDFAENFTMDDLNKLGEIVNTMNEDAAAAIVEVREDSTKKKR